VEKKIHGVLSLFGELMMAASLPVSSKMVNDAAT
jgi:hypothetical protein